MSILNQIIKNSAFRCLACVTLLTLTLSNCSSHKKYDIDPISSEHPATIVFLKYMESVAKSENFDSLSNFFSAPDQRLIQQAMGWRLLSYSASYNALKNGSCDKIKTTPVANNRVYVDCIGEITYKSYFFGESIEKLHLRVFLAAQNSSWLISKAGYVHTQNQGTGKEFVRVGLKFKSLFE